MDSRQTIYLILLAIVTLVGSRRIAGAMWLNAVLTLAAMHLVDIGVMTDRQGLISTGIADLLAASILLCIGGRAVIVSLFYSIMTPSYVLALWFGVSSYNAYWPAYILGILQLIVAGARSGSGGLGVGDHSFSGFTANGFSNFRAYLAGFARDLPETPKGGRA